MNTTLTFRGESPSVDRDELYEVPILRFSSTGDLAIDTKSPARYIISDPSFELPLDFLLYPKDSDGLLVGIHGAEQRPQSDLPKFQFGRSFLTRSESVLLLSDATLLRSHELVLGWMFGSEDDWLIARFSELVTFIQGALGAGSTTLVGHSGGGFCAVAIGSMIPNSRAVSVNGQTVLSAYEPWTVETLAESARGKGCDTSVFLSEHADRLDLRRILERRAEGFKFAYYGHGEDPNTMSRLPMLPLLAAHYDIPSEIGGYSSEGDIIAVCDWDRREGVTPHALPGTVLPFIDSAFGRSSNFDIKARVGCSWR